jgi:hypothetical protein
MVIQITDISISGYLVGGMWWPAGVTGYKRVAYSVTREDGRFSEPGTLRDHVLHLLMEQGGDFQGAELAHAEIIVTAEKISDSRHTIKRRYFPITMFPSISDCVNADWEGPDSGED